jgi:hypothetical protein
MWTSMKEIAGDTRPGIAQRSLRHNGGKETENR